MDPHRENEEKERKDTRNEHDIPVSLLQTRLIKPLKVNDLLLELPARLKGQIFFRRHAAPRFADTRECRGFDELAQEVAARLASRAEDER
jgi:hypothetical protein